MGVCFVGGPGLSARTGSVSSPSTAVVGRTAAPRFISRSTRRVTVRAVAGGNGSGGGPAAEKQGSALGAGVLLAGCAMGAGMLALPVETAEAGYAPSEVTLLIAFTFSVMTGLLVLEGSKVTLAEIPKSEQDSAPFSFLSMAETGLGSKARFATGIFYLFIGLALETAYISGGGGIIASELHLTALQGQAIFVALFGSVVAAGSRVCDFVNRGVMLSMVAAFGVMISRGIPAVDPSVLLARADWSLVFPGEIAIGLVAFTYQAAIPSMLQYLGGSVKKTRQAIFIGNTIPLVVYSIYEAVALSVVPYDPDASRAPAAFLASLGEAIGGSTFYPALLIFSMAALVSSYFGNGLAVVACLEDVLKPVGGISKQEWLPKASAIAITLSLPLYFASAFPDSFTVTLENVGPCSTLLLFGIVPSLVVWQMRGKALKEMTGRKLELWQKAQTPGGKPTVAGVFSSSMAMFIPEVTKLAKNIAHIIFP